MNTTTDFIKYAQNEMKKRKYLFSSNDSSRLTTYLAMLGNGLQSKQSTILIDLIRVVQSYDRTDTKVVKNTTNGMVLFLTNDKTVLDSIRQNGTQYADLTTDTQTPKELNTTDRFQGDTFLANLMMTNSKIIKRDVNETATFTFRNQNKSFITKLMRFFGSTDINLSQVNMAEMRPILDAENGSSGMIEPSFVWVGKTVVNGKRVAVVLKSMKATTRGVEKFVVFSCEKVGALDSLDSSSRSIVKTLSTEINKDLSKVGVVDVRQMKKLKQASTKLGIPQNELIDHANRIVARQKKNGILDFTIDDAIDYMLNQAKNSKLHTNPKEKPMSDKEKSIKDRFDMMRKNLLKK